MADFWYVEPTHTIRNVDTTRITPLILPWIGNFQAKDFALMILGITPHLCMLVTFFFFSICTNVIITVSAKSIKDIGLFYRFKRRRSYREA